MPDPKRHLFYQGTKYSVYLTDDGLETWDSLKDKHSDKRSKTNLANLAYLIKRYADFGTLNVPKQLNGEGDGFFAIKNRQGFRAYCWPQAGSVLVSHFIFKNRDKLKPADKARMKQNRELYS